MDSSEASRLPTVSAELFTIPLEGGSYLIYAPLRRSALVGNSRLVNFLADLKNGAYDRCADPHGCLVALLQRLEIVDAGPEILPRTPLDDEPRPTTVSLFLTTACSLRCSYCYAAAGDGAPKSMSFLVAKRGIDFVLANATAQGLPRIEINYHGGGEPSVNWRTLTRSLVYARDRAAAMGVEVFAAAATNGMLSDRRIDWIIDNLNGLAVSFDGLPAVHDAHRVTGRGRGSSEGVMHTLRRLDSVGFRYGIRLTVTEDTIPHLPDSVAFVFANFKPEGLQVEPSYQLGRWRDAPSAETDSFIAAFREAQALGHEISFSTVRIDTLADHFCGATQGSFCLTADGNVSSCYEAFVEEAPWAELFFYGAPNDKGDGYHFNRTRLEHLSRHRVSERTFCRGCFARWHCGGDCLYKAFSVAGPDLVGTPRCRITRELLKDQILARIAKAGGLFWHGSAADAAPEGMECSP